MKKLFITAAILLINISLFSQVKPDGFGNVKWGQAMEEVRGNIQGKLYYTDEKKIIISKDGDIEYLYGFFYMGLSETEAVTPEEPQNTAESPDKKQNISKLFYVSVKFPYLTMSDVRKKIEEKYGPATGENIKNNKGAVVWDADNTMIVMWVDSYEKDPFCMKINYYSKEIAKEVTDYQKLIFNNNEIEILKRLSL